MDNKNEVSEFILKKQKAINEHKELILNFLKEIFYEEKEFKKIKEDANEYLFNNIDIYFTEDGKEDL
jgi:hypothetical protein